MYKKVIHEVGMEHYTKKRYMTALAVLRKNIAVDMLHECIFLICKAWFFILFLLKWHVLMPPFKIFTIIHE